MSYEDVQKDKNIEKIFIEKYSDKVRIIDINFSKELCGGCHTTYLGNIGFFKIKSDISIAKGIRRIEAITGKAAEDLVYEKEDFLSSIATILNISQTKIFEKIENLVQENKFFTPCTIFMVLNLPNQHLSSILGKV